MALISLEDLEGLDDEQPDDDITDNPEPTVEDDQLLSHWQAVASTHQVSVPRGEEVESALCVHVPHKWSHSSLPCVPEMTGPIHDMSHNRQQREPVPFAPVSHHEKVTSRTMWSCRPDQVQSFPVIQFVSDKNVSVTLCFSQLTLYVTAP